MMRGVACTIAAVVLLGPARADDALLAAQSRAAQIVVTTRVAGILCPGIEVDEPAIRALMEHAQITDRDIMSSDWFGPEDEAVARSFKLSTTEDPDFYGYLGERGAKLLRSK